MCSEHLQLNQKSRLSVCFVCHRDSCMEDMRHGCNVFTTQLDICLSANRDLCLMDGRARERLHKTACVDSAIARVVIRKPLRTHGS